MRQKLKCISILDDDEPANFTGAVYLAEAQCTEHIQIAESVQKAHNFLKGSEEFVHIKCSNRKIL